MEIIKNRKFCREYPIKCVNKKVILKYFWLIKKPKKYFGNNFFKFNINFINLEYGY